MGMAEEADEDGKTVRVRRRQTLHTALWYVDEIGEMVSSDAEHRHRLRPDRQRRPSSGDGLLSTRTATDERKRTVRGLHLSGILGLPAPWRTWRPSGASTTAAPGPAGSSCQPASQDVGEVPPRRPVGAAAQDQAGQGQGGARAHAPPGGAEDERKGPQAAGRLRAEGRRPVPPALAPEVVPGLGGPVAPARPALPEARVRGGAQGRDSPVGHGHGRHGSWTPTGRRTGSLESSAEHYGQLEARKRGASREWERLGQLAEEQVTRDRRAVDLLERYAEKFKRGEPQPQGCQRLRQRARFRRSTGNSQAENWWTT